MNFQNILTRMLPRTLALVAVAAGCCNAAWALGGEVIGEATLVIGVARVAGTADESAAKAVERGAVIRVGDRIETAAGGHVHIRFVDGGQISVRPLSRLVIEDYRHASAASAQSAIRFRLDEGVVRSVTGSWGQAERERFRLNTPIAAIGIKGTDFVVKADSETVFATVQSGAIIVAPLDSACRDTFGPCLNGREQLLSADMRGKMLELTRQTGTPRLVPAVDLISAVERPPQVEGRAVAAERMARAEAAPARAEAPIDLASKITSNQVQGMDLLAATSVPAASPAPAAPPGPVAPVVVAPVVVTPVLPPVVEQLAWGRLYSAAEPGDTLSQTFAQAQQNGRTVLVGNVAYTLFRQPSLASVLNVAETSAGFRLAGGMAQLTYQVGGRVDPVQVTGGNLQVDFARSSFTTGLSLASEATGNIGIAATGQVSANGVFVSSTGDKVAGALTLDGREAGYLFEKNLTLGALRGITLWGR